MIPAFFSIYAGQSAGDQFSTWEAVEDFEAIIFDHATVLDFHAILGPSVAKPGIAAAFNGKGHIFHNFHSRELIAGGSTGSGNGGSRIAGTEAAHMRDRPEEMPTRIGPLGRASPPTREVSPFHPFFLYVFGSAYH